MSHIIKTMVLAILIGAFALPRTVGSTYIPVDPRTLSPREVITYYSNLYGADEVTLMKMATCESTMNPKAIGDGGRARNIFQYHKPTFDRYSKLLGETLDYHSYHDQAKLTAWLYVNHPEELRAWTSFRALQNGGTYKFYSKLLQKHFVIHCS